MQLKHFFGAWPKFAQLYTLLFSIFFIDQDRLDAEINTLRSNLKPKVNNLRDKEGQPELKGHGLKALDRHEIQAVKAPTTDKK